MCVTTMIFADPEVGKTRGCDALPPRVGRVLRGALGRGQGRLQKNHAGPVGHQARDGHEGAGFALPELLLLLLAAGNGGERQKQTYCPYLRSFRAAPSAERSVSEGRMKFVGPDTP